MQIKQHMFTVWDQAAGSYRKFFMEDTIALAMRGFDEESKNPESNLCKYPEDYTLFYLGTWNLGTAEFTLCEPKAISTGHAGAKIDPNDPALEEDLGHEKAKSLADVRKLA